MIVDFHRGEVTVVGQRQRLDLVQVGCNAVQLHHGRAIRRQLQPVCPTGGRLSASGSGTSTVLPKHAPETLLASLDADVCPRYAPDTSDLIDGAIGELSMFHETYGYYAHGIDDTTATLPAGWANRLVPINNENTAGAIVTYRQPHCAGVGRQRAPGAASWQPCGASCGS